MLANFMMHVPEAQRLALQSTVDEAMMTNLAVDATPVMTIDLDVLTSSSDKKFELPGNNSNIAIKVSENPTTGYTWSVDTTECGARLTSVQSQYVRNSNGANNLGVGGTHQWVFKTPDPAENYVKGLPCDLTFSLARPWEKQNGPIQSEKITVVIN